MRIALDAMGGDFAPANPVAGAVEALRRYDQIALTLVGDEARVRGELAKHDTSGLDERLGIRHASQVVDMTDSGLDSVRRKKDSSISRAVDMIKEGAAEAVVSAGHTGALVAASIIKLRTLPGIERPGLAVLIPTQTKPFLLIDAGANPDPHPEHVVGYAIMGSIYSRDILGIESPRVALLSNGTEESKGNDFTKAAHQLLRAAKGIHFAGNTEGHALFSQPVEVVVCDGFVGNIVLKTVEGLAKAMSTWLKSEMKRKPIRMLGALLAKGGFQDVRNRTNTEEYGGSPLLGVNGICIKAHGNSSPLAIRNAIRVAFESKEINPRIIEAITSYNEEIAEDPVPST